MMRERRLSIGGKYGSCVLQHSENKRLYFATEEDINEFDSRVASGEDRRRVYGEMIGYPDFAIDDFFKYPDTVFVVVNGVRAVDRLFVHVGDRQFAIHPSSYDKLGDYDNIFYMSIGKLWDDKEIVDALVERHRGKVHETY